MVPVVDAEVLKRRVRESELILDLTGPTLNESGPFLSPVGGWGGPFEPNSSQQKRGGAPPLDLPLPISLSFSNFINPSVSLPQPGSW